MKLWMLCLLAVSQIAFAKGTELECEAVIDGRTTNLTTIEIDNLVDCDFIKTGTVCDYEEGHDRFSALAFDPKVIQTANPGDQITGSYLNGYVWKTWVTETDQPMTCLVK